MIWICFEIVLEFNKKKVSCVNFISSVKLTMYYGISVGDVVESMSLHPASIELSVIEHHC